MQYGVFSVLGASSVMCAETLREEGFTGKVTIATQEKYLPYDRPKLSKVGIYVHNCLVWLDLQNQIG